MKKWLLILSLFCYFLANNAIAEEKGLSVYFSSNSKTIEENEKIKLHEFLKSFDSLEISSISLFGYCDDIGSTPSNIILSNERVESIKKELLKLNVSKDLFKELKGMGEVELKNNENIEVVRKQNRRVDIKFSYAPPHEQKTTITEASKEILPFEQKTIITEVLKETTLEHKPSKKELKIEQKFIDSQIGDKIVFDNILFEGNRSIIKKQSFPALEMLSYIMQKYPNIKINIQGHVCCGIDDGYDADTRTHNLSETRAKAVYDYLIQNNISPDRMTFEGLAGRFPTGRGDTADKRVEIVIVEK